MCRWKFQIFISHACIRRWKFAVKLNWEFKLPKSQRRMMMHAIQFESIVRIVMKASRGSERRENDLREAKEFFHHLCTHAISLHSLFIPNHHIEFKEREKWAERDGSVHLCCIIGEGNIDQIYVFRFSKNNFRIFSCSVLIDNDAWGWRGGSSKEILSS